MGEEKSNENARRRPLTRLGNLAALAPTVPCSLWCGRALEARKNTANDFVEVHNEKLLEEFGLKLQYMYAT